MKVDLLAFGAHPDDVEMCCSGTLAAHRAMGHPAGIVDFTRGESGTRGNSVTRMAEARQAAKILGLAFRDNLGMKDGFLANTEASRLAVVKKIRQYRPSIVLANALQDRHPDHSVAARIVADACFLAGLPKVKSSLGGKVQKAWRPHLVLHYIQDRYIKPDVVCDISGFMEIRSRCIAAYKSQFFDSRSKEPETPISSEQFQKALYFRPLELGRMVGVQFAEGFNSERQIGVANLFELK